MNDDDPLSPMIKGNFSSITKDIGVEVPSHAQRILRKLSEMRNNDNLCDTELCCQGDSYLVHRSVLAGGSVYFANYFDRWVTDPPQKKVLLRSVDSGALSVLLDFLYSGVLNITTSNMFDIFVAADKLQVEEARYVCITKLHVHLNPETSIEALNFAQLYSLPALAEVAISLICTEPLVYTSRDTSKHLTPDTWEEVKQWLIRNRAVINPYVACANLLQIQPGSAATLRVLFSGMIDERTENLLCSKVLPTALSILSAARANIETCGEHTTNTATFVECRDGMPDLAESRDIITSTNQIAGRPDDNMGVSLLNHALVSLQPSTATCRVVTVVNISEDRGVDETDTDHVPPVIPQDSGEERVCDPRLVLTSLNQPSTEESSVLHTPTSDSSGPLNPRTDIQQLEVPPEPTESSEYDDHATDSTNAETPTPPTHLAIPPSAKHPNSRLWTISCNHPGTSQDIQDDVFNRVSKKRRIAHDFTTETTAPHWTTKILLLGGCNSTMSTVRTIFRHIQPFSVVTGVTVVRDNLSLSLVPQYKDDDEWDESGSLAQLCYGCAAVTIGTKAYVFGGKDANSQYLATFQEFDMVNSTCKLLPNGPHPKESAVAVRIGEDIYIVGGRNNTVQHGQYLVDRYSGGKWESVAPCYKIGYLGAAASCNGLLYTFCGQRPHGKATDTVMCYEPHSDSWSPQPNAPTTMNACQATAYQRKVFLLATEYKNLILFQFQPEQQLWSKINKYEPYLCEPQNFFIMNSAIVSHEGYLYVLLFMCEDVVRVVRVQKFNIATGEWEIVSTKPVPVQNSGVVLTNFVQSVPVTR